MAFFSFGKKDKNPTDPAQSEEKTPATPPKIQTPPNAAITSTGNPPDLSGLLPSTGMAPGAATTQPMVMPRPLTAPPKPTGRPQTGPTRSTQRIVLPAGQNNQAPTRTASMITPTGRINLPMGMILRALPPEVLAADLSEFEASGAAATEIGLPMNLILGQLPSGKVEIPLGELVPHFPPGYLQPTKSITSYLPNLINLPLMDVVMRIPPDLLALRPDQRDVDASVINMADPFTEEILREQAEAARRPAETNIIDESQVSPAEEFVPRDQAPPKPTAPPPMANPSAALPNFPAPPRPRTVSMPPPPFPARPAVDASPMAPTALPVEAPQPPPTPVARPVTPSPSGRLPNPTRASTPVPARPQAAVTSPVALPSVVAPPAPPPPLLGATPAPVIPAPALARPTSVLPVPLPPRPTLVPQAPQPPLRPPVNPVTPSVPVLPRSASDIPEPEPAPVAPPSEPPAPPAVTVKPGEPDAAAEELQRLAALANQSLENPAPAPTESGLVPGATTALPTAEAAPEPPASPAVSAPPAESELQPAASTRPFGSKTITAPMPPVTAEPAPSVPAPEPAAVSTEPAGGAPSVALNLNSCTASELLLIPGCTAVLAEAIVRHRAKIGSFKKVEDLLDVPGMNSSAYSELTGETPPQTGVTQSVAELLGFPPEQKLTLKEVTERIGCWPDVTGCLLSQKTGLHLVGHVPAGFDKAAIVAFAPKMFDSVNKSFTEITGAPSDELIIPTTGTSFHIFRRDDLYLIILCRLPQMPDRHAKIARLVLAGLGPRPS